MDYSLATELKEAGYPLEEVAIVLDRERVLRYGTFQIDNKDYYLPTLSELIEACGGKNFILSGNQVNRGVIKWYAQSSEKTKARMFKYFTGKGWTPEEAVARLFLALKKK